MSDARAAREVLRRLQAGNERWAAGNAVAPRRDRSHVVAVAASQTPLAMVFTCSDSRVPVELIFDQGVGDLFVVRTAGHVLDDAVTGTLHYGAEVLETLLIVVLGHTCCGAITAAWEKAVVPPGVASVIERIGPSTCAASSLDGAIRDHVEQTVVTVREWTANSPQILVVGGVYEIRSGQVLWLESCSPTTR